jgi:PKD repeat protein
MKRGLLLLIGSFALIAGACTTSGGGGGGGGTNHAPVAVLGASATSGNAPLMVTFSSGASTDDHGITGYAWDFGDSSPIDHTANPTHVYTSAGNFLAQLTVTDAGGLSSTDTRLIIVSAVGNRSPVAAASGTPTTGQAPLSVSFTDASFDSDGHIASWSWNFGDGSPVVSTPSPTHVYTAVGSFVATLTVTDNGGASDTTTIVVHTTTNLAPIAIATATPDHGKVPLTVAFNSASSTDPDGTIVSRSWDFGDGSPLDTTTNPTHQYATVGPYTATLTVTDNSGVTDTANVLVTVNPDQSPVARAAANPSSGRAPLAVTFTDSSSDPDGSIVSWSWNFGDGSPLSSTPSPTHTYAAGSYTATLTVTDDNGLTDVTHLAIAATVNTPPTAAASATPNSGQSPLTVAFSSAGSTDPDGTIASYSWNFGDGSPLSTAANPSHTYSTPGVFSATLTVTDNEGATGSKSVTVTVTNPYLYVSNSGNDANDGSLAHPKATIDAALSAAQVAGDVGVRVAGGSYGPFTVVSDLDVIGGFDQSFVAGGSNGSNIVTVTGVGGPAATATSVGALTTLGHLTLVGASGGSTTGVLVQTSSNLVLDTDTISSGVPSGAGASAYGVRVLSGSTVTVQNSSITASPGVAGTAGTNASGTAATAGAAGTAGTLGGDNHSDNNNGTGGTGSGSGGAGGAGGIGGNQAGVSNGCQCIGLNTATIPGQAGVAASGGGAGGAGGVLPLYQDAYVGLGGPHGSAGVTGSNGTPGSAGTPNYAAAFTAGSGGGGGVGLSGGGGGGGAGGAEGCSGGACALDWYNGGGGGGGGQGGTGGVAGTGGAGGGGSFGVYVNNATVTIDAASTVTSKAGGAGGNGGTGQPGGNGGAGAVGGVGNGDSASIGGTAGASGGSGTNGGDGGAGKTSSCGFLGLGTCGGSGGGGGGAGGGKGGNGGAGGGGAGGSSVAVLHSGTGSAAATGTTLVVGSGGAGGTGGNTGTAGASQNILNV